MLETLSESKNAPLLDFLRSLAEKARMDFANGRKPNEYIEKPVPIFADFGSKNLGWAKSTARNKAVELIEGLWNAGRIEYISNGKKITKLKIINLPPRPVVEVAFVPKTVTSPVVQATPPTTIQAATKSPEEIASEEGERNEKRFYELMWMLGDIVAKLTNVIKKFEVRRSRKWSKRDTGGEDIAIFIKTARKKWKFVYNVKSSWAYAEKFNREIYLLPEQKNVDSKKATVTHEWKSDRRIIHNVVDDFIKAGLLELKPIRRLIAYQFSSIPPSQ